MDDMRALLHAVEDPSSTLDLESLRARVQRRRSIRIRRRFAGGLAAMGVAVPLVAMTMTNSSSTKSITTDTGPPTSAAAPSTTSVQPTPSTVAEHAALGPKVVVAEGTFSDRSWRLLAYDSTDGFCLELQTSRFGGSGGCGPGLGDRIVNTATTWSADLQAMYGNVRADVTRIEAVLDSGEVLTTSPIGSDAGFPVNFFVIEIPLDTFVARVVCYDPSGAQVGVVTQDADFIARTRQAFVDFSNAGSGDAGP